MYLIVAAFLGLMGVSGFFGRRNLSRLDITLDYPDEIFAATHLPVKVTLANRRRILPAFLIRVTIGDKELLFPFLAPKGICSSYADFFFPGRGMYGAGRIYLSSVYPFNFFIRYKQVEGTFETVVFPRIKKCELPLPLERLNALPGERSAGKYGQEGEMVSVRNYTAGDPSKYIHWKSSAKTGELKTKEFSAASGRPVVIDFERIGMRDEEEKISCVTHLIIMSFRKGIPVGLKINSNFHKPALSKSHKIRMLRELALYGYPQTADSN